MINNIGNISVDFGFFLNRQKSEY